MSLLEGPVSLSVQAKLPELYHAMAIYTFLCGGKNWVLCSGEHMHYLKSMCTLHGDTVGTQPGKPLLKVIPSSRSQSRGVPNMNNDLPRIHNTKRPILP